jgi:hypothetical protein
MHAPGLVPGRGASLAERHQQRRGYLGYLGEQPLRGNAAVGRARRRSLRLEQSVGQRGTWRASADASRREILEWCSEDTSRVGTQVHTHTHVRGLLTDDEASTRMHTRPPPSPSHPPLSSLASASLSSFPEDDLRRALERNWSDLSDFTSPKLKPPPPPESPLPKGEEAVAMERDSVRARLRGGGEGQDQDVN